MVTIHSAEKLQRSSCQTRCDRAATIHAYHVLMYYRPPAPRKAFGISSFFFFVFPCQRRIGSSVLVWSQASPSPHLAARPMRVPFGASSLTVWGPASAFLFFKRCLMSALGNFLVAACRLRCADWTQLRRFGCAWFS